MLSGIGPPDELERQGIEVRVPLDGVGRNLQDRYAVSVAHRTLEPWKCFDGVSFSVGDPAYREWLQGRGIYRSNGAVMALPCARRPLGLGHRFLI